MKSVWVEHKGKRIFHCNYYFLSFDDFAYEITQTESIVCDQPFHSVLELTDIRGISMTRQVVDLLKMTQKKRKEYIIFEVVLILERRGPKRLLLEAISRSCGYPMKIYSDWLGALDWLAIYEDPSSCPTVVGNLE